MLFSGEDVFSVSQSVTVFKGVFVYVNVIGVKVHLSGVCMCAFVCVLMRECILGLTLSNFTIIVPTSRVDDNINSHHFASSVSPSAVNLFRIRSDSHIFTK